MCPVLGEWHLPVRLISGRHHHRAGRGPISYCDGATREEGIMYFVTSSVESSEPVVLN
jgi:hypothetical protein